MMGNYYYLSEAEEQKLVVQYCQLHDIRVVHIPNEAKRSVVEQMEQKRLGLAKGFPDICIPIPRKGYHGLYLEMKRVKRANPKVSKEQKDWIDYLNLNGYRARICYGFDEARTEIDRYFQKIAVTEKAERTEIRIYYESDWIIKKFREADDKEDMIHILAELNASTVHGMRQWLKNRGYTVES